MRLKRKSRGMPTSVTRDQVLELVGSGAQLVEVLPQDEYDEEHLPGAVHLPLKRLDAASAEVLDRSRPVIVYCWDAL
jgi:rhodanese-related sulfurtransferase